MVDKKSRAISQYRAGVFQDLLTRIKLILRLIADRRVSFWLKLIPIGSMFYLLFPDLAPGPIDDVAVLWVGLYVFVELCPADVVEEHMMNLTGRIPPEWREAGFDKAGEEVIEGQFREVE